MLTSDDLLVFNDTRVIPARLFGQRNQAAKSVLFERVLSSRRVLAQIRANRSPALGVTLLTEDAYAAKSSPVRTGSLSWSLLDEDPAEIAEECGHAVATYIKQPEATEDRARYQTVYGKRRAPYCLTAGLHFDRTLLTQLEDQGVRSCHVTLHVGAGTFQPVRVDQLQITKCTRNGLGSVRAAFAINKNKHDGGRLVAVGTTGPDAGRVR